MLREPAIIADLQGSQRPAPRGWETVGGHHRGPLFPKLDGGYTSRQGNELCFLSPPLLAKETSSEVTWNPLGDLLQQPPQASGRLGLLKHVAPVHLCLGRAAHGREWFAERKWLKPDTALFSL